MGARPSDCEMNTAVVEIRLTRDEDIIHTHDQEIQVPSSSDGLSSHSIHMEESIERFNVPNIMPQLDGPTSVRVQKRQLLPITRQTIIPGDGYPNDSDSDSPNNRFCENRRYLGRRGYPQERGGRPPNRENNQGRDYSGRGGPLNNGDPLMMEDP